MQITKDRLEALRATQMKEEDTITFWYASKHSKGDHYFYIGQDDKKVTEWEEGEEDNEEIARHSESEFLELVKGKELEGDIWLGYQDGKQKDVYIQDWDQYAKKMGVSKLVVLATKVPEVIARRFEYFAEEKSAKLRQLVVEYVKKEWVDQADDLVFRDSV